MGKVLVLLGAGGDLADADLPVGGSCATGLRPSY